LPQSGGPDASDLIWAESYGPLPQLLCQLDDASVTG